MSIQAKRSGAVPAALALGGNLGDVAAAFATALALLAADPACTLTAYSSVYRTPPWGKKDQPPFLNMAALLPTELSARELLELCLSIETRLGRLLHTCRAELEVALRLEELSAPAGRSDDGQSPGR